MKLTLKPEPTTFAHVTLEQDPDDGTVDIVVNGIVVAWIDPGGYLETMTIIGSEQEDLRRLGFLFDKDFPLQLQVRQ